MLNPTTMRYVGFAASSCAEMTTAAFTITTTTLCSAVDTPALSHTRWEKESGGGGGA
jgi:hypothetical protein